MLNALLLVLLSGVFPINLEWNANNRTDVPYELTVNLDKLGARGVGLQVFADGKALPTTFLQDKDSFEQKIRFAIPAGAESLSLAPGEVRRVPSEDVDNILVTGEWTADDNSKCSRSGNGMLLESTKWKIGVVRFSAVVPEGCAGKPVALELDCRSLSKMAWTAQIGMNQYDVLGNLLPEPVYDSRWTTHIRPAGKFTPFRESGFLHPDAARVELYFRLIAKESKFDNYGLPLANPDDVRPQLLVTKMALRPAATFPFPKYDDSFFAEGVSGGRWDSSLVFDGDRAFAFSTRSMAAWSGSRQLREEKQLFYPSAEGTVEIWLKSFWHKDKADQVLFEAAEYGHGSSRGPVLTVAYSPKNKSIRLELADVNFKYFKKSVAHELPEGVWTHFAVTFTPGGDARLFVDGKTVISMPLTDYMPLDLAKTKAPNDAHAVLFFIGGSLDEAKSQMEARRILAGLKYYVGQADALRISTGLRYSGDFTPSRNFCCDPSTRALFNFDRSFDGVSGGGIGWISGILSAPTDRQSHKVGALDYYPEKLEGEMDPRNILFPRVKDIPVGDDFQASEVKTVIRRTMHPGESVTVSAPEGAISDYVEIKNTGKDVLKYPTVLGQGDIDARSYGDIANSLNIPGATDRNKVNRFFNWFLVESDYFASHQLSFPIGSDKFTGVEYNPLENLNGYCGFECGPLNSIASTMFATAAGCPACLTWGYGHLFEEVFFDGMNHTYDLSAQKFFPSMNFETEAGLREIEEQTYSIRRFGGSAAHFTRAGSRVASYRTPDYPEKFAVSLNPGESIRFWKINDGAVNNLVYTQSFKTTSMLRYGTDYTDVVGAAKPSSEDERVVRVDRFFPEFGNGFICFDGKPTKENPAFVNLETDSFCYNVRAQYTIVGACYKATLVSGKEAPLQISTDGGKTFRDFKSPATYAVMARRGYLIRVCAPLGKVKRFEASTEIQVNSRIVNGMLKGGDNTLTLKAEGGSEAQVSWQYRTKGSPITFVGARTFGSIKGCEKSIAVLSEDKMTVNVEGISSKAMVVAGDYLSASLSGGKLRIGTDSKDPHISWVTVKDGNREKTLSVVICRDARLVLAETEFVKSGDSKVFKFDPAPAGKYAVFTLQRLPVDLVNYRAVQAKIKVGTASSINGCRGVNCTFDYLKDIMGPDGGRGVWRWTTTSESDSYYAKIKTVSTETADAVRVTFTGKEGSLELDSILLVPEPSAEFREELVKGLFGRNNRPWALH